MSIFAILQYLGAALVLIGFTANARGWMRSDSREYLVVNFFGAAFLVTSAFQANQWGFFILNAVWTLVAMIGLSKAVLARQA